MICIFHYANGVLQRREGLVLKYSNSLNSLLFGTTQPKTLKRENIRDYYELNSWMCSIPKRSHSHKNVHDNVA